MSKILDRRIKKDRDGFNELKQILFEQCFSEARHKKIITEAAKKSAKDQQKLSKQYSKLLAKLS